MSHFLTALLAALIAAAQPTHAGHGLGLTPLTPAQRTMIRQAIAAQKRPTPAVRTITPIDLASHLPAVIDQNGYSCCTCCAGTMAHRLSVILAGGTDTNDSVSDPYDCINGGRDQGASLPALSLVLTGTGMATQDGCPDWQIPTRAVTPEILAERIGNKLSSARWEPDEPHVLAAIEAGRPVVIGITVTQYFLPDGSGYIGPMHGRAEGGHAVLVVGVRANGSGHDYHVRNSWGSAWGDSGNCWLDSSWIDAQNYGAFSVPGAP